MPRSSRPVTAAQREKIVFALLLDRHREREAVSRRSGVAGAALVQNRQRVRRAAEPGSLASAAKSVAEALPFAAAVRFLGFVAAGTKIEDLGISWNRGRAF